MPLADLLPIAGALSAPAFFLIFALAALGSPMLALVCLTAGKLRSTAIPEAYASRLTRMALTCALPALIIFLTGGGLAAYKAPWLADWLRAEPLGPGLFAVVVLAFCASLATMRLSRPSARHGRQNNKLWQTFIICALAFVILILSLTFGATTLEQARAVLHTPMPEGIGVVPLVPLDLTNLPANVWTSLAALCALCMATAGAVSLEYLLFLRDREPFGRDALANVLRLAARCVLRSALLAGAFLPALWTHLPDMPLLSGGMLAAKVLLGITAFCCVMLCLCSGLVAHSTRPWSNTLCIHGALASIWLGLTACLSIVLVCFYAA